eukprot:10819040-Lingulodinium_polyedra.AAC.1
MFDARASGRARIAPTRCGGGSARGAGSCARLEVVVACAEREALQGWSNAVIVDAVGVHGFCLWQRGSRVQSAGR